MEWRSRFETWRSRLIGRFSRRRDTLVFGGLALAILLLPAMELFTMRARVMELAGHDFTISIDAARRWLDGGAYYPASQLSGPFVDDHQRILYPPTALLLFGPLAALPRSIAAVLWFGFPFLALAHQWIRLRPRPIVWPFLALCVAWPPTLLSFAVWNPTPIFVACLGLATIYHWPSALNVVKPSILPFAFWGANHRSWWIALVVLGILSIPFGALWLDWFRVIENSRIGGIWHSIDQWPMFLWPILVWFGRPGPAEGTIERSTG